MILYQIIPSIVIIILLVLFYRRHRKKKLAEFLKRLKENPKLKKEYLNDEENKPIKKEVEKINKYARLASRVRMSVNSTNPIYFPSHSTKIKNKLRRKRNEK
jgi:hypothetical protein